MLMPYNADHRQSCQKWDEIEYPINAVVDSTAQPSKVAPVRNSRIRRSHKRLEIIEPPAMIILRIPAHDTETRKLGYMAGHDDPNKESDRPRLINKR